jgi:phosphoribosylaminoimidazole-succinocarboxamide synthase
LLAPQYCQVVAEGKTKIVLGIPEMPYVYLRSKDDITAGDGAKCDVLEGKAIAATTTTANVFSLLRDFGIPTHFIRREDEQTVLVHRADMVPIEIVMRRRATGSYLKRNPDVEEGQRFEAPVVEFFFKHDPSHDPMMLWDGEDFLLADAKTGGLAGGKLSLLFPCDTGEVACLESLGVAVFDILELAWSDLGVELIDLKIEVGFTDDGRLVVADEINNDSWRLWPGGDKAKMLDKQVYRDATGELTLGTRARLVGNYILVAEMTSRWFV